MTMFVNYSLRTRINSLINSKILFNYLLNGTHTLCLSESQTQVMFKSVLGTNKTSQLWSSTLSKNN